LRTEKSPTHGDNINNISGYIVVIHLAMANKKRVITFNKLQTDPTPTSPVVLSAYPGCGQAHAPTQYTKTKD